MSRLTILLIFLTFGKGICFYDPIPPGDAKIYDDRPTVIIKLTGFSPNVKISVRFWDDTTAFARPASYLTYTDAQGKYTGTISVSNDNTSASYLLLVDQNDNGSWDVDDYGAYRSGLTFATDSNMIEDVLTYSAGTLKAYTPGTQVAQTAPVTGVKTCIYTPNDQTVWESADMESIAQFPVMEGARLKLTDWFPTGQIDSASTTSDTFLPTGNYNETCVTDLNGDDRFNGSDSVNSPGAVTLP